MNPCAVPYLYEKDAVTIQVGSDWEEVPVCVICNTARPERHGGHHAGNCPCEADNLKRGYFNDMPEGFG